MAALDLAIFVICLPPFTFFLTVYGQKIYCKHMIGFGKFAYGFIEIKGEGYMYELCILFIYLILGKCLAMLRALSSGVIWGA